MPTKRIEAQFPPGTTVHVIARTMATNTSEQMERAPDPRMPARTEQRPPTDFDVITTAVTDDSSVTTLELPNEAYQGQIQGCWMPGGFAVRPEHWRWWPGTWVGQYWAIGWEPSEQRWKRIGFSTY